MLTSPTRRGLPSSFKPTAQQAAIYDAFNERRTVVVRALAGTGKTTTLKGISGIEPMRPGTYLAFNKSIVQEAEGTFPGRVNVTTAHSLAYRAIGHLYSDRLPGGSSSKRMSAKQMASRMKVRAAQLDSGTLNPVLLTRVAQATVGRFIKSADKLLGPQHLPPAIVALHGNCDLALAVMPVAERIWNDLASPSGSFFFTHDVYLKLWSLVNPVIQGDYILFDEAQDSDPVIASVVGRQAAQRVYVGDENQAIYGWRGAVDAMSNMDGATYLGLTRSFRFGPAIAEQANLWLSMLDSDLRVEGHPPVQSVVGECNTPRAILCRGNGTALGWVMAMQERGIKVALAPGDRNAGKDIERFAWAAGSLMKGEGSDHPDLLAFQTWDELLTFVDEEHDTGDLKRMVGIINRVGVGGVIDAVRGLSLENDAVVTVSTAHKAKGLEWSAVKVADDFTPKLDDEDQPIVEPADLMLAYVTVTRAKLHLDPGPLGEPERWETSRC